MLPYIVIFFLLARWFAKKHAETPREFYMLLINWWIKMVACILYAWMIIYYYQYGDPLAFRAQGQVILDSVDKHWENIKYLFLPVGYFREYLSHLGYTPLDLAYYEENNYFVARLSAIVSSFTFGSYLVISFVFTNLAYYGFALIYTSCKKIIKGFNKVLALGILFVPSGVYWSSALAKEPICILALGIMFSCLVTFFIQKKYSFKALFYLVVFSLVVFTVKDYIFYCFVLASLAWLVYNFLVKLLSGRLYLKIFFSLFLVMLGILIFLKRDYITAQVVDYVGKVISSGRNMYEIMASVREGGGSFINIGDVDVSSFSGILRYFPQGLANVLLRPYPWEISNPLMVLTVLENLFFIFLLFRILLNARFFVNYLKTARNFQVFAIAFTLTMAIAIAISTFNFGSMVRYKMPFMPFWATFLLISNVKLSRRNTLRKMELRMPMPEAF